MVHLKPISTQDLPRPADDGWPSPPFEFETPFNELPDNGAENFARALLRSLLTAPSKKGKEA